MNESEMEHDDFKVASTKKMMSYSFGYAISTGISQGFTQILPLIYLIEVFGAAGVEVAQAGFMMGIAFTIYVIWNAINDPLIGYLTDRPFRWTKKWGMRFPWIVIGVIPTIICWQLLFMPPEVDPANPWPIFWYLVIITCALDGFFSLFSTHHSAGYTAHFTSDFERRKSGAINNILPQLIGIFTGLIFPIIYKAGNMDSVILAISIGSIIRIVYIILLIPGIRESDELKQRFLQGYETSQGLSFWKTMKMAFKRRNFVVTLVVFFLTATAYSLYLASGVYFVKHILLSELDIAVYYNLASLIGFVGGIFIWIKVAKKLGKKNTYTLGLLLIVFTFIPPLWISTLEEMVISSFIGGLAFGGHTLMLGPIAADVYDDVTCLTGIHQEAKLEGVRTFFNRFSIILQMIIIIFLQVITNYDNRPEAFVQTPEVIIGIRIQMGLIPSLMYLVAFFIMLLFYDLTDEKTQMTKEKLRELGL